VCRIGVFTVRFRKTKMSRKAPLFRIVLGVDRVFDMRESASRRPANPGGGRCDGNVPLLAGIGGDAGAAQRACFMRDANAGALGLRYEIGRGPRQQHDTGR
jgi:hypothetical protein